MSVHILFADLSKTQDPREYMIQKLESFFQATGASREDISALVHRIYVPGSPDSLPIIAQTDLPQFSEGKQKFYDNEIALFKQLINKISPLIRGEELLPDTDQCALLKADYAEYKAGTPVLIRKTNQATIYYIYNLAQVNAEGRFSYLPDMAQGEEVAGTFIQAQPMLLGVALWIDLLLEVAKGISGAIGEKIGNELLNKLFPDSTGLDYKQMLDDFSKIVIDANKIQTISEQGGIVNGVLNDNNEYYIPRKNSGASKTELYQKLLDYHNKLSGVIGMLQYKETSIDYTKAGLPLCVMAINTHLAIYQEMALEDPNASDPLQSSNVTSIRMSVPTYVTYAKNKANEIIDDGVQTRLKNISDVLDNPWCEGTTSGVVCKSRYFFMDNQTGYRTGYYEQSGCNDDAKKRCNDARLSYVEQIRQQTHANMTANLQWIFDITTEWNKLPQDPLPHIHKKEIEYS